MWEYSYTLRNNNELTHHGVRRQRYNHHSIGKMKEVIFCGATIQDCLVITEFWV